MFDAATVASTLTFIEPTGGVDQEVAGGCGKTRVSSWISLENSNDFL